MSAVSSIVMPLSRAACTVAMARGRSTSMAGSDRGMQPSPIGYTDSVAMSRGVMG